MYHPSLQCTILRCNVPFIRCNRTILRCNVPFIRCNVPSFVAMYRAFVAMYRAFVAMMYRGFVAMYRAFVAMYRPSLQCTVPSLQCTVLSLQCTAGPRRNLGNHDVMYSTVLLTRPLVVLVLYEVLARGLWRLPATVLYRRGKALSYPAMRVRVSSCY